MKSLQQMTSAEILAQDFLRCNSYENLLSPQRNQVQKAFDRAQVAESTTQLQEKHNDLYDDVEEKHIYETIDGSVYKAVFEEESPIYESIDHPSYSAVFREQDHIYEKIGDVSRQKTETVFSEKTQTLTIEGKFKKKDAKNIQRIEKLTQTLVKYNPGQVNFDVHFNMIMGVFKGLKTSSGKLAAFLYLLDSTKDKEGIALHTSKQKIYKELPRKYRKLIKKSNPQFSLDMSSNESAKSIAAIRAHLQKRSIFVRKE